MEYRNLNAEQVEYISSWWHSFECPEEKDLLQAVNNMCDKGFIRTRSDIKNWVQVQISTDTGYWRKDLDAINEITYSEPDNSDVLEDIIRNGYMFENCMEEVNCYTEEMQECLYEILLNVFIEALEEIEG